MRESKQRLTNPDEGMRRGAVETLKWKNSNLARTAARHKVDSAKIATGVRAELLKAKVNGDELTGPEAHNIEIVKSQAGVAKR